MAFCIALAPLLCVVAGVHASPDGADVASPVSLVEWFLKFYSQVQQGPVKPLEGIVRQGEVLFVPHGWWHLAINLEVMSAGRLMLQTCNMCGLYR